MLHHSRQCGIVVEPRSDGMETIRCRMLYDPRLQPKVVKTVAYRWELSVGPGETFSRGLSGENISEFFLAHSGILLIFERRRAPKRCGARGNLPPLSFSRRACLNLVYCLHGCMYMYRVWVWRQITDLSQGRAVQLFGRLHQLGLLSALRWLQASDQDNHYNNHYNVDDDDTVNYHCTHLNAHNDDSR